MSSSTKAKLSAKGPTGTGDGGAITVYGNGDLKIGAGASAVQLSAQSQASAAGGSVEVAFVENLTLDGDIPVSAGLDGDGDGGSVNLHDISSITLAGAIVANGHGEGTGGNVTLDITGETPVTIEDGASISAKGGDTGNGGTVTINNAPNFDVNEIIKVDGGAGGCTICAISPTTTKSHALAPRDAGDENFDGSLTINNVTCTQIKNSAAYSPWPLIYYDCVNASPTSTESEPALFAKDYLSGVTSTYADNNVHLYVFTDAAAYNSFFTVKPPLNPATPTSAGENFPETRPLNMSIASTYQKRLVERILLRYVDKTCFFRHILTICRSNRHIVIVCKTAPDVLC